jgi:DNA polymerase/3'-5' exonuclease PolX
MNNRELADTFQLIGDLMEIKGENVYKIIAYRKAADSLLNLGRDINDVQREGSLTAIPGVGKAIAEKIDELITTGQLEFLEKLKSEVPAGLAEMLKVPELGPKKVAMFWKEAGIDSLAKLETAAREGQLRSLPGMGQKSEAKILAGIAAVGRRTQRHPLAVAYPAALELLSYLKQGTRCRGCRGSWQPAPDAAYCGRSGSIGRIRKTQASHASLHRASPGTGSDRAWRHEIQCGIPQPPACSIVGATTRALRDSIDLCHGL